nr:class I SAM-dependent methyltransferase [Hyphomicrobium sp.]
MTGFTKEWLHVRESADLAARNKDIANAVAGRFALRDEISVVDLGCGTGANLRATSQLLPNRQTWRLIDRDQALLDAARNDLARWADQAEPDGQRLLLKKGHAAITVTFSSLDLAENLVQAFDDQPALVTASALFDLVSEQFIRTFTRLCADHRTAFFSALTYNGVQRWNPHRPADNQIASAFHRHQLGDKGFGPAAGPMAAAILADQFRLNGYTVLEGESPWVLGRGDRMLLGELQRGNEAKLEQMRATVDEK